MIFVVGGFAFNIDTNSGKTQVLPDRGNSMNFQSRLFSSATNKMYDVFEQSLSIVSH